MASAGTLSIYLLANAAGVQQGLSRASQAVDAFQSKVQSASSSIGSQLMGALGIGGGLASIGWGAKLAIDAERAQAGFAVLTGSAEKAKQMLAEIKQFSQVSPISQSTLRDAATVMIQFGVATDNVIPALKQFGDITGGEAQRLSMMSLAFAQMSAAGRLMGQDLLQMVNAGFNPLQEISRKTGESLIDLKKRMEGGGVSAKEVADAFESATAAGGRFHGRLTAEMGTTGGKIDKLKASVANLAQAFGETLAPSIARVVDSVTPMIQALGHADSIMSGNVTRILAFAAGTAALLFAFSKIVAGVQALVAAYRALATASAIAQALSGPKGWLVLAGGLAAATLAGVAVNKMFSDVNAGAAKASSSAEAAANAVKKVGDTKVDLENVRNMEVGLSGMEKEAEKAREALEKVFEAQQKRGEHIRLEVRTPGEELAETATELQQLFGAGAISAQTLARALEAAEKKAAGTKDHLKDIDSMREGVSAAVQGTTSGFSAVQQSIRDRRANDMLVADQRATAERAANRVAAIERLPPGQNANEKLNALAEQQVRTQAETNDWLKRIEGLLSERETETAPVIEFEVAEF